MKFVKSLLATAVLAAAASSASADTIRFDPDGAGAQYTRSLVDTFQLDATAAYAININLGADNTLGLGDTFTESFRLRLITTEFPTGTASVDYTGGVINSSNVYMDVFLTGSVTGYNNGGTPTTASSPNSLQDDTLSISFSPAGSSFNMFYDADRNVATAGDQNSIATFALLSGGADDFKLVNGTATSDFGVSLKFTSANPLVWFLQDGVTPISTFVPLNLAFALADSSVNLQSVSGNTATNTLTASVTDNGTTAQVAVPEPATLGLLGLGLLGLCASARRRKA